MYTQYDIFGKELIPMETGKLAGPWAILRKKMFLDGLYALLCSVLSSMTVLSNLRGSQQRVWCINCKGYAT